MKLTLTRKRKKEIIEELLSEEEIFKSRIREMVTNGAPEEKIRMLEWGFE